MEAFVSTLLILGMMAAVVLGFRLLIRRPASVTDRDPPGLRTIVTFAGRDEAFLTDDREDEPYIGVRLFGMICGGLGARGIVVENRGTVQYAQRAECVVGVRRYAMVMEWIDELWLVSVEWLPVSQAERRHLALTHQVFAPRDSQELRQLLSALDDWLKSQPGISDIRWFRREQWRVEDLSDPSPGPIRH